MLALGIGRMAKFSSGEIVPRRNFHTHPCTDQLKEPNPRNVSEKQVQTSTKRCHSHWNSPPDGPNPHSLALSNDEEYKSLLLLWNCRVCLGYWCPLKPISVASSRRPCSGGWGLQQRDNPLVRGVATRLQQKSPAFHKRILMPCSCSTQK